MRYLITGGAGFIGSHLSEHLVSEGHEVIALDDLSSGRRANVAHLESQKGFELRVGSVLDEPLVGELCDQSDVIFHLAAAVGIRMVVESPVKTIDLNVGGTAVVLRQADRQKKLAVIASTSEVYGKQTAVPFHEEMDLVLGPTSVNRWSYACSKAVDEFLAIAHFREKNLPTIVVRLFNTVGPRQVGTYGMVIPRFVEQALRGEPITVCGDGEQTRCFAYVGDVVRSISALAKCPEAYGRVYNVGNDDEISIRQLAERVRDKVNPACEIRYVSYEEAYGPGFEDMRRRVPDVSRLEALIGFRPRTGIDAILDHVVASMRKA